MPCLATVAKAITGAVTAFGAAYAAAVVGDGAISTNEWVAVGVATVTAAFAVWVVPNRPVGNEVA